MQKMRISISRVRDPVLYAAYKELGPRGFSVEARKILEAYAMGQARPAKEIKHYQLYLGDADVCPYFYVGDAFYTLSETFPFRARAEITRAVLSMAFVSSMTSMPAVQALPQPSAGQLSAGPDSFQPDLQLRLWLHPRQYNRVCRRQGYRIRIPGHRSCRTGQTMKRIRRRKTTMTQWKISRACSRDWMGKCRQSYFTTGKRRFLL